MERHLDEMGLTILGGSSVGTPVLLLAIMRGVTIGYLPPTRVSLYGRNAQRLERVKRYTEAMASRMSAIPGVRKNHVSIATYTEEREALRDADYVLCQIRPGGMAGRAADEGMAIAAGVPGDEGLGPSGLVCYLRGRATIRRIVEACARWAPQAVLLQMTSPLSLVVADSLSVFGDQVYGICELPMTTSARVCAYVEPRLKSGPLNHAHAGLNHRSWLYAFTNADGNDVTEQVISAIDDAAVVCIEPDTIGKFGAIPVSYLRLFLETEEELQRQQKRKTTRGAVLQQWTDRLDAAYCAPDGPRIGDVTRLLAQRRMDWYDEGVLPILAAFAGSQPVRLPLNLRNGRALPDLPETSIVEVTCLVSDGIARPESIPGLPPDPAQLTRVLAAYEAQVLRLPNRPPISQLEDVLSIHPLVPRTVIKHLASAVDERLHL